jgi:hypothetical protein
MRHPRQKPMVRKSLTVATRCGMIDEFSTVHRPRELTGVQYSPFLALPTSK